MFRWVEGRYDLLPAFATELVQRRVAVIVTSGNAAARAAQLATASIPILFVNGSDPVELGVRSVFWQIQTILRRTLKSSRLRVRRMCWVYG